ALFTALRQDHLSSALRREERAVPTAPERQALAELSQQSARIAYLAGTLQHNAGDGSPVARIRIPRIGASFVVVNGTSSSALCSASKRLLVFARLSSTVAVGAGRLAAAGAASRPVHASVKSASARA